MKKLLCLLPLLSLAALAGPIPLLVVGDKSFRAAEVQRVDAFTARITHADGIAKISAWELDEAQQRQFGFDPSGLAAERNICKPFIGLTERDARERYGDAYVQPNQPPAEKILTFEKNGIYLWAHFYKGRIAQVIYSRKNKEPFVREEAEVLIQNNNLGGWKFRRDFELEQRRRGGPVHQNWESNDGTMIATNFVDGSPMVAIRTVEYLKAMIASGADALKGL